MEKKINNFKTICEEALKTDKPQILIKLYTNENNKENKKHNKAMKRLLSLCQDEPLEVKNITKQYAEVSIGKRYIEKILLEINNVK